MRYLTAKERNVLRRALYDCDDAVNEVRTLYTIANRSSFAVVTTDPLRLIGALTANLKDADQDDMAFDFYSSVCLKRIEHASVLWFTRIEWNTDSTFDGEDQLDAFFEPEPEDDEE